MSLNNLLNKSEIDTTTFLNLGVEIRTGGNLAPKIIDLRNNKMNVILRDWVNALGGSVAYCKRNVCPEPFKILLEHNEIYCDCNMQVYYIAYNYIII